MYKVPFSSRGKFIKSVGEEYQVVKRRKNYYGCGEEYNMEKRERGSNIIFPIILWPLGRISSGEELKGGLKILEEENKD